MRQFYGLYLPSALTIASDFWRITVIGAIAASRGEVEVAQSTRAFLPCIHHHIGNMHQPPCPRWRCLTWPTGSSGSASCSPGPPPGPPASGPYTFMTYFALNCAQAPKQRDWFQIVNGCELTTGHFAGFSKHLLNFSTRTFTPSTYFSSNSYCKKHN